ncbi:ArnT family glycosyltransferase [Tengunoibacter tsumagoiensis]|uniref:Glycosyltransferase RgtA/B/C/D-like domain-containing protein n=1 Tax=Tengunoibacter tsumagoiensis TaxID=2014871 RepID=A0A402A350_9CHLR|nr:glycosyltransferase family 39 protein [Tengunoibacter tsumagoiensis]GCE13577.1 hypothetical protein KTT_34360 [Tengunoibacter tsumagoiensis]
MLTTSSLPKYTVNRIVRKQARAIVWPSYWPLVLILAMQAIISLVTLRNTAFQDEALYLYAGRQLFHYWLGGPAPLDRYAFYFSGYPGLYPVIAGVLDMIGGLELARAYSLLCMMGINITIYYLAQKFFQRPSAIFASALYGSLGTVLYVGRLATFDAMCFCLVAVAALLAFQVSTSRRPWLALLIGPLLVLAVLTKYAAMLYVPAVLGILIFCSLAYIGWWRMLIRLALALLTLAASLYIAYQVVDKSMFHAIAGTTTDRTAFIQKSRLELFTHVMQMAGIVYLAALVGVILVYIYHRRLTLVALVMYGSSWLVPAYHIYKMEAVSLDKHFSLGLLFCAALAGYALAWISGFMQRTIANANGRYWLSGLCVVLLVFVLGTQQSQTIFSGWANTTDLSYALHTQLRHASGRILVEDIEVARYDSEDITEEWQWNGVYYFYYSRPNQPALLGDPAIIQALKDRYFTTVELSFNYQPAEAQFIARQMIASKNYDLVATVPFVNSYGTGHFYIWRSALEPGHGNFKSMSQVVV